MERVVSTLEAKIVRADGSVHPCRERKESPPGWGCSGLEPWMHVSLERIRTFNIERNCIRAHPPKDGKLVIDFGVLSPSPRVIGAGLDDRGAMAGGTPLEVEWSWSDGLEVEMVAEDAFHRRFQSRTIQRPDADQSSLQVEISSPSNQNRTTCLTLAP